jgi:hypothetical protein
MNQKRCTKCNAIKDIKEFSKSKSRKGGFQCWCKECVKRYYKEHNEAILKWHKNIEMNIRANIKNIEKSIKKKM